MKSFLPSSSNNFYRFVFYNSLLEEETRYGEQGQDLYLKVRNNISSFKNDEIDTNSNSFRNAIFLLEKMIQNEQRKERAFVKHFLQKDFIPKKTKEEIENCLSSENFSYLDFVNVLNKIYLGNETLLKQLQEERDRIIETSQIIEQGIKRPRGAMFKRLEEQNDGSADLRMQKIILEKGKQTIREDLFKGKTIQKESGESYTYNYLTTEARRRLSTLTDKRKRDIFLQDVKKRNFSRIAQAIHKEFEKREPFQKLVSSIEGDTKKLKQIQEILDLAVLQFLNIVYAEEVSNQIAETKINPSNKTLLIDFLRDEISDKGPNRNTFSSKISQNISNFIDNIENTLLNKDLMESLTKSFYSEGKEESKEIRKRKQEILTLLKQKYSNLFTEKGKLRQGKSLEKAVSEIKKISPNEEVEELLKELNNLVQKSKTSSKASLSLREKGRLWFQEEINGVLNNLVIGAASSFHTGRFSNKDDSVSTFLTYELPEVADDLRDIDTFLDSPNTKLDEAFSMYNKAINRASSTGEMSASAIKERNQQIKKANEEFQKFLEQQITEIEEKDKKQKKIPKMFVIHETDKEYGLLSNKVGFSAGLLGKEHSNHKNSADLISALENISIMAEKGGLSPLDVEKLAFCAINAADFLVGGSISIKNSLEDYLSILAGALMFNDSELIMEEALQNFNQKTFSQNIEQIHLYRLNNLIFPFSFVLQKTLVSFKRLENEIEKNTKKQGNEVHIQNHYTFTNFSGQEITKETWEQEGQKAFEHTSVSMTFLAGFADILDELSKQLTSS